MRSPLFLALFLAACGGATSAPKPDEPANVTPEVETDAQPGPDDAVLALRELRSSACACVDDDCRDRFERALDAWLAENGPRLERGEIYIELGVLSELMQCASPDAQAAQAELAQLRDRACACVDAACAEVVRDEFRELATRHKDTRGSQLSVVEFRATFDEMMACVDALVAAGSP